MDWKLVHKILWNVNGNTIIFAKFVDNETMTEIRFFTGIIPYQDYVTSADCLKLLDSGIEIYPESMKIFWEKSDYKEHDLLGDSEKSLLVAIK